MFKRIECQDCHKVPQWSDELCENFCDCDLPNFDNKIVTIEDALRETNALRDRQMLELKQLEERHATEWDELAESLDLHKKGSL